MCHNSKNVCSAKNILECLNITGWRSSHLSIFKGSKPGQIYKLCCFFCFVNLTLIIALSLPSQINASSGAIKRGFDYYSVMQIWLIVISQCQHRHLMGEN